MNPATPAASAVAASPILPVAPAWAKRKLWTDRLARQVARDPQARQSAARLGHCADRLGVRLHYGEGDELVQKVQSARFCQQRLCPVCSWRKATAWRRRLIPGLEAFHAEHPKHRPLFLTLTVRNCPVSELRSTIRDIHSGWDRLTRRSEWPTPFWLRRTEVTLKHAITMPLSSTANSKGPGTGRRQGMESTQGVEPEQAPSAGGGFGPLMAHPHIHALLLVPPSYFSHGYVRQTRWQQLWWEAARLDYPPVVDVRKGRAQGPEADPHRASVAAAIEVAKYISKATDLMGSPESFRQVSDELMGVRMISVSRKLAQFVRPCDIDGGEMTDEMGELEEGTFTSHFFADWDRSAAQYFFQP